MLGGGRCHNSFSTTGRQFSTPEGDDMRDLSDYLSANLSIEHVNAARAGSGAPTRRSFLA